MDQTGRCCDSPPQIVYVNEDTDPKYKEHPWKQTLGQDSSSVRDDVTTDDSKLQRMHKVGLQDPNSQRVLHCIDLADLLSDRAGKKGQYRVFQDDNCPQRNQTLRRFFNSCQALHTELRLPPWGRFLRCRPKRACLGCPQRLWSRWRLLVGVILLGYLLMVGLLVDEPEEEGDGAEEDELSLRDWVLQHESSLRAEYRARAATAHEVCDQHGVYETPQGQRGGPPDNTDLDYQHWQALKRVNWEYLYHAPKQRMLYCKVPKSGSSTWVYNLLKLAGLPEQDLDTDIGLHKLIRDYYPRSNSRQRAQFRKILRLLVVRHPFDRILSAYRDKLQDYQRDLEYRNGYYSRVYGRDIVRVHRDPTDGSLANKTEPTWPEFVSYLLATAPERYDEHWRPIHLLCSPCVMRYTVIAKMETFSEDTQFVINELGLDDELTVEWRHPSGSDTSDDTAERYYSLLTTEQVDELYQKYRLDFELFDYDADDHRDMAKPN